MKTFQTWDEYRQHRNQEEEKRRKPVQPKRQTAQGEPHGIGKSAAGKPHGIGRSAIDPVPTSQLEPRTGAVSDIDYAQKLTDAERQRYDEMQAAGVEPTHEAIRLNDAQRQAYLTSRGDMTYVNLNDAQKQAYEESGGDMDYVKLNDSEKQIYKEAQQLGIENPMDYVGMSDSTRQIYRQKIEQGKALESEAGGAGEAPLQQPGVTQPGEESTPLTTAQPQEPIIPPAPPPAPTTGSTEMLSSTRLVLNQAAMDDKAPWMQDQTMSIPFRQSMDRLHDSMLKFETDADLMESGFQEEVMRQWERIDSLPESVVSEEAKLAFSRQVVDPMLNSLGQYEGPEGEEAFVPENIEIDAAGTDMTAAAIELTPPPPPEPVAQTKAQEQAEIRIMKAGVLDVETMKKAAKIVGHPVRKLVEKVERDLEARALHFDQLGGTDKFFSMATWGSQTWVRDEAVAKRMLMKKYKGTEYEESVTRVGSLWGTVLAGVGPGFEQSMSLEKAKRKFSYTKSQVERDDKITRELQQLMKSGAATEAFEAQPVMRRLIDDLLSDPTLLVAGALDVAGKELVGILGPPVLKAIRKARLDAALKASGKFGAGLVSRSANWVKQMATQTVHSYKWRLSEAFAKDLVDDVVNYIAQSKVVPHIGEQWTEKDSKSFMKTIQEMVPLDTISEKVHEVVGPAFRQMRHAWFAEKKSAARMAENLPDQDFRIVVDALNLGIERKAGRDPVFLIDNNGTLNEGLYKTFWDKGVPEKHGGVMLTKEQLSDLSSQEAIDYIKSRILQNPGIRDAIIHYRRELESVWQMAYERGARKASGAPIGHMDFYFPMMEINKLNADTEAAKKVAPMFSKEKHFEYRVGQDVLPRTIDDFNNVLSRRLAIEKGNNELRPVVEAVGEVIEQTNRNLIENEIKPLLDEPEKIAAYARRYYDASARTEIGERTKNIAIRALEWTTVKWRNSVLAWNLMFPAGQALVDNPARAISDWFSQLKQGRVIRPWDYFNAKAKMRALGVDDADTWFLDQAFWQRDPLSKTVREEERKLYESRKGFANLWKHWLGEELLVAINPKRKPEYIGLLPTARQWLYNVQGAQEEWWKQGNAYAVTMAEIRRLKRVGLDAPAGRGVPGLWIADALPDLKDKAILKLKSDIAHIDLVLRKKSADNLDELVTRKRLLEKRLRSLLASDSPQGRAEALKEILPKTKVVDEQGVPKRMYHGTTTTFTEFDPNKANFKDFMGWAGSFFSEDPRVASGYTKQLGRKATPNVRPVYLDLHNPLDIETKDHVTRTKVLNALRDEFHKLNPNMKKIATLDQASDEQRKLWRKIRRLKETNEPIDVRTVYHYETGEASEFNVYAPLVQKRIDELERRIGLAAYLEGILAHTGQVVDPEPLADILHNLIDRASDFKMIDMGPWDSEYHIPVDPDWIRKALEKLGYDGIRYQGGIRGGGGRRLHEAYATWKPSRILPRFDQPIGGLRLGEVGSKWEHAPIDYVDIARNIGKKNADDLYFDYSKKWYNALHEYADTAVLNPFLNFSLKKHIYWAQEFARSPWKLRAMKYAWDRYYGENSVLSPEGQKTLRFLTALGFPYGMVAIPLMQFTGLQEHNILFGKTDPEWLKQSNARHQAKFQQETAEMDSDQIAEYINGQADVRYQEWFTQQQHQGFKKAVDVIHDVATLNPIPRTALEVFNLARPRFTGFGPAVPQQHALNFMFEMMDVHPIKYLEEKTGWDFSTRTKKGRLMNAFVNDEYREKQHDRIASKLLQNWAKEHGDSGIPYSKEWQARAQDKAQDWMAMYELFAWGGLYARFVDTAYVEAAAVSKAMGAKPIDPLAIAVQAHGELRDPEEVYGVATVMNTTTGIGGAGQVRLEEAPNGELIPVPTDSRALVASPSYNTAIKKELAATKVEATRDGLIDTLASAYAYIEQHPEKLPAHIKKYLVEQDKGSLYITHIEGSPFYAGKPGETVEMSRLGIAQAIPREIQKMLELDIDGWNKVEEKGYHKILQDLTQFNLKGPAKGSFEEQAAKRIRQNADYVLSLYHHRKRDFYLQNIREDIEAGRIKDEESLKERAYKELGETVYEGAQPFGTASVEDKVQGLVGHYRIVTQKIQRNEFKALKEEWRAIIIDGAPLKEVLAFEKRVQEYNKTVPEQDQYSEKDIWSSYLYNGYKRIRAGNLEDRETFKLYQTLTTDFREQLGPLWLAELERQYALQILVPHLQAKGPSAMKRLAPADQAIIEERAPWVLRQIEEEQSKRERQRLAPMVNDLIQTKYSSETWESFSEADRAAILEQYPGTEWRLSQRKFEDEVYDWKRKIIESGFDISLVPNVPEEVRDHLSRQAPGWANYFQRGQAADGLKDDAKKFTMIANRILWGGSSGGGGGSSVILRNSLRHMEDFRERNRRLIELYRRQPHTYEPQIMIQLDRYVTSLLRKTWRR